MVDVERGALLQMFILLTCAAAGASTSWLDPTPYVTAVRFDVHPAV